MLDSVLEFLLTIDSSDKERLDVDIRSIESDIESMKLDGSQTARLEIRIARLADLRERFDRLEKQELRAEEFLLRAGLIEGSLNRTRLELASLRVDSAERGVSEVSEALQRTIDQAREVLEEMRKLGYQPALRRATITS